MSALEIDYTNKPQVISFSGVNGAGKTTIAKIALKKLKKEKK